MTWSPELKALGILVLVAIVTALRDDPRCLKAAMMACRGWLAKQPAVLYHFARLLLAELAYRLLAPVRFLQWTVTQKRLRSIRGARSGGWRHFRVR